MTWRLLLVAALAVIVLSFEAHAAPPMTICGATGTAYQSNCMIVNPDGSIDVSGGGGGGGAVTMASGAVASGAYASGSVASGALVDIGAAGTTTCATDTGSCNVNAKLSRIAERITSLIASLGGTGSTGAAVPATAAYMGVNVGGNLVGLAPGTAGSASTQALTVQGIASMTPILSTPAPATSGGLSISYATLANSTNATVVKASAGQIYQVKAFNNSASIAYIKFFNKATTPTCNSDTVVDKIMIPASTSGAGVVVNNAMGNAYSTGISYCVTGAIGDTDNTAVAASAFSVTVGYK